MPIRKRAGHQLVMVGTEGFHLQCVEQGLVETSVHRQAKLRILELERDLAASKQWVEEMRVQRDRDQRHMNDLSRADRKHNDTHARELALAKVETATHRANARRAEQDTYAAMELMAEARRERDNAIQMLRLADTMTAGVLSPVAAVASTPAPTPAVAPVTADERDDAEIRYSLLELS